jgi:hypothetical protein
LPRRHWISAAGALAAALLFAASAPAAAQYATGQSLRGSIAPQDATQASSAPVTPAPRLTPPPRASPSLSARSLLCSGFQERRRQRPSRDGGAALPQNCSLTDEQRRDQEDHLVAATHGERAGSDPTEHPWMRRRDGVFARRQSHWPGSVASLESQSPPAARFQSIRKQLPNGLIAHAADLRVSINHLCFDQLSRLRIDDINLLDLVWLHSYGKDIFHDNI